MQGSSGSVQVEPISDFDLNKTIFKTLSGKIPRLFMKAKIIKEPTWSSDIEEKIKKDYTKLREDFEVPVIDQNLVEFIKTNVILMQTCEWLIYGAFNLWIRI